ncbi:hypothetical protein A6R68_09985 [Neotoma lepida]|uniref:Uncharacterized protein n=1 Tax=Neotoma lepida TaxID=56216 RepID=A0A1A6FZ60_NEOLE|nr:hypothetical protein A6R68_09985 [Neotoma lepida]
MGDTVKTVIEDYVQPLSGYYFKVKFDPDHLILLMQHLLQSGHLFLQLGNDDKVVSASKALPPPTLRLAEKYP